MDRRSFLRGAALAGGTAVAAATAPRVDGPLLQDAGAAGLTPESPPFELDNFVGGQLESMDAAARTFVVSVPGSTTPIVTVQFDDRTEFFRHVAYQDPNELRMH